MAEGRVVLEACVASLDSARAAIEGGADRLELNRELERDGLTPSRELLATVLHEVALPAIVMIRPHDRGYAYAREEWRRMRGDIERALEDGAAGIAFGALTTEDVVDAGRAREVVRQAEDREVVFHRAFDELADQAEALERLIDAGVRRVLTSGGAPTALEGVASLRALVDQAGDRIEILPGAGVGPDNVGELVRETGCRQVHGTFRDRSVGSGETAADIVAEVRRVLEEGRDPDAVAGGESAEAG